VKNGEELFGVARNPRMADLTQRTRRKSTENTEGGEPAFAANCAATAGEEGWLESQRYR